MKTLKELGIEYEEYIKDNEESIEKLKAKIKAERDYGKRQLMNKDLFILEDMHRDLISTAEHLKHYYEER